MSERYSKMPVVESELRLVQCGAMEYETIIRKLTEYKIALDRSCILSVYDADDTTVRRTQIFNSSKQKKSDIVERKTREGKPWIVAEGLIYAKLFESKEQTINKTINKMGVVRMKYRTSADIPGTKSWRLDVTAVYETTWSDIDSDINDKSDSRGVADKLRGIMNTLMSTHAAIANRYEVEIEWRGRPAPLKTLARFAGDPLRWIAANLWPHLSAEWKAVNLIYNLGWLLKIRPYAPLLKALANQPIELNRSTFYENCWPPTGYFITDKADGYRAWIVSVGTGNSCHLIKLTDSTVKYEELARIPGDNTTGIVLCIDCEVIGDKIMAFDLVTPDYDRPFEQRLPRLKQAVSSINEKFMVTIGVKEYIQWDSATAEKNITEFYGKSRPYTTDGLILVKPGFDYKATPQYKWKSKSTIDLKLVKVKTGLYEVHVLDGVYVSVYNPDTRKYESDEDLDGKIAEFEFDLPNNKWILIKMRPDKTTPNARRVAEEAFANYIDPFSLNDLWTAPGGYFNVSSKRRTESTDLNRYKRSWIKRKLVDVLEGCTAVLDMGVGRGGDCGVYSTAGTQTLIGMDIDKTALIEFVKRCKQAMKDKALHAIVADMRADAWVDNVLAFQPTGVNLVVCNMAIHYITDDISTVMKLLTKVYKVLAPGGLFVITCINGRKLWEKLQNTSGPVEIGTGFTFEKQYVSKEFLPSGQKISVKLSFADKPYTEYLVNVDWLIECAHAVKFELVERQEFGVDESLKQSDKENIKMHEWICFKKL